MNWRRNSDFGSDMIRDPASRTALVVHGAGMGFQRRPGARSHGCSHGRQGGRMADSIWAIGLMSGTSGDGIDAALLKTDGETIQEVGPPLGEAYDAGFRAQVKGAYGHWDPPAGLERALTERHADAVARLLAKAGKSPAEIGIV